MILISKIPKPGNVDIYPCIVTIDGTVYGNPNGPVFSNKEIAHEGNCDCQVPRPASLMVFEMDGKLQRVPFCSICHKQVIPRKEDNDEPVPA